MTIDLKQLEKHLASYHTARSFLVGTSVIAWFGPEQLVLGFLEARIQTCAEFICYPLRWQGLRLWRWVVMDQSYRWIRNLPPVFDIMAWFLECRDVSINFGACFRGSMRLWRITMRQMYPSISQAYSQLQEFLGSLIFPTWSSAQDCHFPAFQYWRRLVRMGPKSVCCHVMFADCVRDQESGGVLDLCRIVYICQRCTDSKYIGEANTHSGWTWRCCYWRRGVQRPGHHWDCWGVTGIHQHCWNTAVPAVSFLNHQRSWFSRVSCQKLGMQPTFMPS